MLHAVDLRGMARGRSWLIGVAIGCLACTAAVGSGLHVAVSSLEMALERELDDGVGDVLQLEPSQSGAMQTNAATVRMLYRMPSSSPRSLVERGVVTVRTAGREIVVPLLVTDQLLPRVQPVTVRSGRWWTAAEARAADRIALIGYRLADSLFGEGLPRRVRTGQMSFDVLGTVESGLTATVDVDRALVIPHPLMRHVVVSGGTAPTLFVVADGREDTAESFYESWWRLQRTRRGLADRVTWSSRSAQLGDMSRLADALGSGATVLSAVLSLASLVSVAALMSTIARIHERTVGITRAMGATRLHISGQGAIIGAVIGGVGIVAGEALAAGAAQLLPALLDIPVVAGRAFWWALALGAWLPMSMCVLVGVVSFARLARRPPSSLLA